ncbi:MBL fold metallo-hydrolase [Mesorhizobium sanjuanii]|uniref:MBL fold metallo-hydrolase n=1 Tax=Mesorhizobium sanjuanii TaxID=2037900 RepID=A0A2A6F9T3_9HYPH|nr:N-acyl homoserine lactonase family protein [Mesorhizobium sanjuanii]PDQ18614.1 MBL fold metallo-hydrolase [Mesorhizobium sanjuanii]
MSTDIRLYMFQTGQIRQKEVDIKLGYSQDEFFTPIPWYLIVHPKGNIVIDGGTAVEAARDPVGWWGDTTKKYYPIMDPEEGCVNQLGKIGMKPDDIKFVLHSHLHLDHSGACGNFPKARHLVQRREIAWAFAADWFMQGGYIKKDLTKDGISWDVMEGEDQYDVFGDGSVQTFLSPGHTPGHQSIMVRLPNTGSILLAIDAAYTMDHWEEKCLPGALTSAQEAAASVRRLRRIAEKENAIVVPGHDMETWKKFKKAPAEYYD